MTNYSPDKNSGSRLSVKDPFIFYGGGKINKNSRFKDWKTSDRVKTQLSECWDDPIQIAAYCSILGLNKGALVKMYENGPPNVILMNEGKGLDLLGILSLEN